MEKDQNERYDENLINSYLMQGQTYKADFLLAEGYDLNAVPDDEDELPTFLDLCQNTDFDTLEDPSQFFSSIVYLVEHGVDVNQIGFIFGEDISGLDLLLNRLIEKSEPPNQLNKQKQSILNRQIILKKTILYLLDHGAQFTSHARNEIIKLKHLDREFYDQLLIYKTFQALIEMNNLAVLSLLRDELFHVFPMNSINRSLYLRILFHHGRWDDIMYYRRVMKNIWFNNNNNNNKKEDILTSKSGLTLELESEIESKLKEKSEFLQKLLVDAYEQDDCEFVKWWLETESKYEFETVTDIEPHTQLHKEHLQESKDKDNSYIKELLEMAFKKRDWTMVQFLMDKVMKEEKEKKKFKNSITIHDNWLLRLACQEGKTTIANYLVEMGIPIWSNKSKNEEFEGKNNDTEAQKKKNNKCPLELAIEHGYYDLACDLNRKAMQLNKYSEEEDLPLFFIACQIGDHNFIQEYVKQKGLEKIYHIYDKDGNTPLICACKYHQWTVVRILLDTFHVDVNEANKRDLTPLMICCANGSLEMATVLLKYQAHLDNREQIADQSELEKAIYQKNWKVLLTLLEEFINKQLETGDFNKELLIQSWFDKDFPVLKGYISLDWKNISNKRHSQLSSLHLACLSNDLEWVEIELKLHSKNSVMVQETRKERNVDNSNHLTPVLIACLHNNLKMVQKLVANQSSIHLTCPFQRIPRNLQGYPIPQTLRTLTIPNHKGFPLSFYATYHANLPMLKFLVEQGAPLTTLSQDKSTVLIVAAKRQALSVVQYILENMGHETENNNNNNGYDKNGNDNNKSKINDSGNDNSGYHGQGNSFKNIIDFINHQDAYHCSALTYALQNKHLVMVKYLMTNGAFPHKRDLSHEINPLHLACLEKDTEFLKWLIEKYPEKIKHWPLTFLAQPVVSTVLLSLLKDNDYQIVKDSFHYRSSQYTQNLQALLMIIAIDSDDLDVTTELIRYGIPLHQNYGKERESLLIRTVRHGYKNMVRVLVEQGLDLNRFSKNGDTALIVACELGNFSIVQYLVQNNANLYHHNNYFYTALDKACLYHHWPLLQYLVENGANPHKTFDLLGRTSLMMACQLNELEMVQCLVDYLIIYYPHLINAKDKKNRTALMYACTTGNVAIVRYLIEQGFAEINHQSEYGETALSISCERGYDTLVQLLLEHQAEVNISGMYGETELLKACRSHSSSLACIKYLVMNGRVNLNVQDHEGFTPLMRACQHHHVEIVHYLVEKGANSSSDLCNIYGESIFHYLCQDDRYLGLIQRLVASGHINIHQKSKRNGQTGLIIACRYGQIEIIKYLVGKGAKVNEHDHLGRTALMYSFKYKNMDISRYLLENSADLTTCKDLDGFSSLSYGFRYVREALNDFILQERYSSYLLNGCFTVQDHAKNFVILMETGNDRMLHYYFQKGLLNLNSDVECHYDDFENFDLSLDHGFHTLSEYLLNSKNPQQLNYFIEQGGLDLGWAIKKYERLTHHIFIDWCQYFENEEEEEEEEEKKKKKENQNTELNHVLKAIQYFLENGMDIEATNGYHVEEETGLMLACHSLNLPLVKLLVKYGANVNRRDQVGETVLHWLFKPNKEIKWNRNHHLPKLFAILTYLIDHGLTYDLSLNNSILKLVERFHSVHLLNYIIEHDQGPGHDNIENMKKSNMRYTLRYEIENLPQEEKKNIKEKDNSGTIKVKTTKNKKIGRKNNNTSAIEENLITPVNDDDGNFLKLMKACQTNDLSTVKDLLHQKNFNDLITKKNRVGQTSFLIALYNKNYEIAVYLMENTISSNAISNTINDLDCYGRSALSVCCEHGHLTMVQKLLRSGANPNDSNRQRYTALMRACHSGHLGIVRCLVEQGAEIHSVNTLGASALTLAFEARYPEIVDYLLVYEKGIPHHSISASSLQDLYFSLLMRACHGGRYYDVVNLIAKGGSQIYQQKNDHNTPLILASGYGYLNIVKYLVEHGDHDGSIFHEQRKIALIQAYDHGHLPVVKYLISIRREDESEDSPQDTDDHDLYILYQKIRKTRNKALWNYLFEKDERK